MSLRYLDLGLGLIVRKYFYIISSDTYFIRCIFIYTVPSSLLCYSFFACSDNCDLSMQYCLAMCSSSTSAPRLSVNRKILESTLRARVSLKSSSMLRSWEGRGGEGVMEASLLITNQLCLLIFLQSIKNRSIVDVLASGAFFTSTFPYRWYTPLSISRKWIFRADSRLHSSSKYTLRP